MRWLDGITDSMDMGLGGLGVVCEMTAVVIILSICYDSDVMTKLRVVKCLKSSYLIAMMAPVAIRCYRAFFVMFVKMDSFVAIPLVKCVCSTKVM